MNPRRLVLAGGTVVFAAIGVAKRRRAAARPSSVALGVRAAVVVPAAVAVLGMQISMPDLPSIFLKFWSIGNVIWDQIQSIVLSILTEAWQLLYAAISEGFHLVDETFELFQGSLAIFVDKVESVTRAVAGVMAQTYTMLDDTFRNFRDQLKAAIEGIYGPIQDWVMDHIPDWISSVFGGMWDVLTALAGIGMDGIALLINFLDDPFGFLWHILKDAIQEAIDAATAVVEFGWEAFWDLFWPLLAEQLGLPNDPYAMIQAAKLLWNVALAWINGDFEAGMRQLLKGAEAYFEAEIPRQVHKYSDQIVGLVYDAFGIDDNTVKVKDLLGQV